MWKSQTDSEIVQYYGTLQKASLESRKDWNEGAKPAALLRADHPYTTVRALACERPGQGVQEAPSTGLVGMHRPNYLQNKQTFKIQGRL